MSKEKAALVIVMSDIARDPRVRRQIDWLTETGWEVDTIGLDDEATTNVREHFPMAAERTWTRTTFGTAVIYGLLPHRRKFKVLTQNRIPTEVQRRVRTGQYELIVFNDRHFVPWVADRRTFTRAAREGHIHLDLHEYFIPTYKRNNLWRMATSGYYTWSRRLFADPIFTSRSTVNAGISALYVQELGIPELAIIRNSPPFADLAPTEVDPHQIKLIHHGMASWDRGLREIVDAMRIVDNRFTMTFMLLGSDEVIEGLSSYAADLGDRVKIVPPAAMRDLSAAVNQFDLEIMFYRPATRNLQLALPNKLFEAVQGRLGLVIGESPMMVEIVERYSNGIIARGWEAENLAAVLNAVTSDQVAELKAASHRAARDLSADSERRVFLQTVTPASTD